MLSVETVQSILNVGLFPGWRLCGMILASAAVSCTSQSAPQSQGKQLIHLEPFYIHTAILFLTFVQYSINYMRYSILYCKTDLVVDDFAQL